MRRYRAKGMKFKRRVILSTDFCEQLLKLEKGAEKISLAIRKDHALFQADGIMLFGRLIDESKHPLAFNEILESHFSDADAKRLVDIPAKFEAILDRSIIITTSKNDAARISIKAEEYDKQNNRIRFLSKSASGDVSDFLLVSRTHDVAEITVEPKLLRAGVGRFSKILFTDRCVIMAEGNTLYMVTASD